MNNVNNEINKIVIILSDIHSNDPILPSLIHTAGSTTTTWNVAVRAFNFKSKLNFNVILIGNTLEWAQIIGHTLNDDSYAVSGVKGNFLIVGFHTNKSHQNIPLDIPVKDAEFAVLRLDTGEGTMNDCHMTFTSTTGLINLIDMEVGDAIYILAQIGAGSVTYIQNSLTYSFSESSTAILLLSLNETADPIIPKLDLLSIEAYTNPNPTMIYNPTRIFLYYPSDVNLLGAPEIILASHLDEQYRNGLVFYVFQENSSNNTNVYLPSNNPFITNNPSSVSFAAGCIRTFISQPSKCAHCDYVNNYYITKSFTCSQNVCPDGSYLSGGICTACHSSCKTCNGPLKTQCLSCDSTKSLDAFTSQCICPSFYVMGTCSTSCNAGQAGYMPKTKICKDVCPPYSFPYVDFSDPTSAPPKAGAMGLSGGSSLIQFTPDFAGGLRLPGPTGATALPSQFTVSLWLYPSSFSSDPTVILWGFNTFTISAGSAASFSILDSTGSATNIPVSSSSLLTTNAWNYIAVSVQTLGNALNLILYVSKSSGVVGAKRLTTTSFQYPLYVNQILVGCSGTYNSLSGVVTISQGIQFSGNIRDFLYEKIYNEAPSLEENKYRVYSSSLQIYKQILAYWRFDQFQSVTGGYQISDSSQSLLTAIIPSSGSVTKSLGTNAPLSTSQWDNLASCEDFFSSEFPKYSVNPQYYIATAILERIKSSDPEVVSFIIGSQDTISLYRRGCQGVLVQKVTVSNNAGYISVSEGQNIVPQEYGSYLDICYTSLTFSMTVKLGQVHFVDIPNHIFPSNGASDGQSPSSTITFQLQGGDQSKGDIIKLQKIEDHAIENSKDYIFVNEEEAIFPNYIITKIDESNYNTMLVGNLDNATYTILWRPSFLSYQVNNTNEYKNLFTTWKVETIPTAYFPLKLGLADYLDNSYLFKGEVITLNLSGPGQSEGDQIMICYTGCNYPNKKGSIYTRINGKYQQLWLGEEYGISNLLDDTRYVLLFVCWRPAARAAIISPIDDKWDQVMFQKSKFGGNNVVIAFGNDIYSLPEIAAINPPFENPTLREGDSIWFQLSKCTLLQMMPSSYVDSSGSSFDGKVQVLHLVYTTLDHSTYSTEVVWEQRFTHLPSAQSSVFSVEKLIVDPVTCNYTLGGLDMNMLIPGDSYMLVIYSRSFKSLNQGYYLFGTLDPNIQQFKYKFTYEEVHFIPNQQLISPDQTQIEIKGSNLGDASRLIGGITESRKVFSVDVSLSCGNIDIPASYIILSYQKSNPSSLILTDLNLAQCTNSSLLANITVYKLISNDVTTLWSISNSITNLQVGLIGCNQNCLTCNGNTSSNCTSCYSTSLINYLYNGQCVSMCGLDQPYSNPIINSAGKISYYQCVGSCPIGTFYDTESKICKKCKDDCKTCTSDLGRSCTSCAGSIVSASTVDYLNIYSEKFLFQQMCVIDCPQLTYDIYPTPNNMINTDFYSHICKINYLPIGKSPISIQIQPIAYSRKLDVKTSIRLRALVNDSTGSMVGISWFAHPAEDVTNLTFTTQNQTRVFQTYNIENLQRTVTNINMNTFNYKKTIVIVKAYTNDSFAFDSIELEGNSAPDLNVTIPTISSSDGSISLNTLSSINIQVNVSNSQGANDTYQVLRFGVFLKVKSLVIPYNSTTLGVMGCPLSSALSIMAALPGDLITLSAMEVLEPINSIVNIKNVYIPALINGPQTLADCTNQSTPILVANQVSAELWIVCEDRFQGVTIQKAGINFTEKYQPSSREQTISNLYNEVIASEANNNFSINLAIKIANNFKAILPNPPQPFMQFAACTRDIQCGHGNCISAGGYAECTCKNGYMGEHCEWTISELKNLKYISTTILNFLNTTIVSPYSASISQNPNYANEDSYLPSQISNILIGLLHNPEVGNSINIPTIIQLCSLISKFSIRVSFRLSDEQVNSILQAVDISMLFVLYNIRKAIFPYFVLNEVSFNISQTNNADFFSTRESLANYIMPLRDGLYKIANMISISQFIGDPAYIKKFTTFELFLNSENAQSMFNSKYGHFAIQSTLSSGFVKLPENLISSSPNLLASNSEFVIRLLKWINSPYLFSEYLSEMHTSVQSAAILDSNGTEMPINLTSPIIYFLPISNYTKNYPYDIVKCKYFNHTNAAKIVRVTTSAVDVNQINISDWEKKKLFPEWNPTLINSNLISNQTKVYKENGNYPEFTDSNGVSSYGRKYGTNDYDSYVPCAAYIFGEVAGIIQRRLSTEASAPITGFYYYFSPWSVWASSLGFYTCIFLLCMFIIMYIGVSIMDGILIPRLESLIELHRLENSEREADINSNFKEFEQALDPQSMLNIKKLKDDDDQQDENNDNKILKKVNSIDWAKPGEDRLNRKKKDLDNSAEDKKNINSQIGLDSTIQKISGGIELNDTKHYKDSWKPNEPITTGQNVTIENTTSVIMRTGNILPDADGSPNKIYNEGRGSEFRRKARVNSQIEDIFTEEHRREREENALSFKNSLIYGNIFCNLFMRTSTTFYRNVRCIMAFDYIYFHMFWAAVLLGTTCNPLGWPEKDKRVYDMVVEKVWIPAVIPWFVTFMNYLIPLLYKIDDKRVLSTKTYNQYLRLQ